MATKQKIPLIIEKHPETYTGLPYITLIEYRKSLLLCVVDNTTDSHIHAYVLDLCGPENVSEIQLLEVVENWHQDKDKQYPVSIEFSRHGLTTAVTKVYKSLNIEFVSRVIGPAPEFDMAGSKRVVKRKRKPIPQEQLTNVNRAIPE